MDFDTVAMGREAVDLTAPEIDKRTLAYLHALRPLLERELGDGDSCIGCHSGASPTGELSLATAYSPVANAPAGRWNHSDHTQSEYLSYLDTLPPGEVVRGYDWTLTPDCVFRENNTYRDTYVDESALSTPLGPRAPWEPGYQNLMMPSAGEGAFRYLTSYPYQSHLGRGGRFSNTSYLLEVLTGEDLDARKDYAGVDHTGFLSEAELRTVMSVIDMGFPYMARCDDRTVPSGPNAGQPWGDPSETDLR